MPNGEEIKIQPPPIVLESVEKVETIEPLPGATFVAPGAPVVRIPRPRKQEPELNRSVNEIRALTRQAEQDEIRLLGQYSIWTQAARAGMARLRGGIDRTTVSQVITAYRRLMRDFGDPEGVFTRKIASLEIIRGTLTR